MSVVNLLSAEYSMRAEAIADTPIFNALAATTPLFSRSVAAHVGRAALSRSCVMPRSPRLGGGRHRRLSSYADHVTAGGRHHLVVAAQT